MKKAFLLGLALLFSLSMSAQHFALKNNLLYDATTTPNLGFEVGLSKKVTLDVSAGYNPFKFNDGKKLKHWLVMPEVRYWTCEKFNGTFIGVHALGGQYNIAGIKLPFGIFPNLKDHRYDGYLYGGGLTLGHQWILNKRWSIEAAIGAGYARVHYDKYNCGECGSKIETKNSNYWGVTKAALSIIYFIHKNCTIFCTFITMTYR